MSVLPFLAILPKHYFPEISHLILEQLSFHLDHHSNLELYFSIDLLFTWAWLCHTYCVNIWRILYWFFLFHIRKKNPRSGKQGWPSMNCTRSLPSSTILTSCLSQRIMFSIKAKPCHYLEFYILLFLDLLILPILPYSVFNIRLFHLDKPLLSRVVTKSNDKVVLLIHSPYMAVLLFPLKLHLDMLFGLSYPWQAGALLTMVSFLYEGDEILVLLRPWYLEWAEQAHADHRRKVLLESELFVLAVYLNKPTQSSFWNAASVGLYFLQSQCIDNAYTFINPSHSILCLLLTHFLDGNFPLFTFLLLFDSLALTCSLTLSLYQTHSYSSSQWPRGVLFRSREVIYHIIWPSVDSVKQCWLLETFLLLTTVSLCSSLLSSQFFAFTWPLLFCLK